MCTQYLTLDGVSVIRCICVPGDVGLQRLQEEARDPHSVGGALLQQLTWGSSPANAGATGRHRASEQRSHWAVSRTQENPDTRTSHIISLELSATSHELFWKLIGVLHWFSTVLKVRLRDLQVYFISLIPTGFLIATSLSPPEPQKNLYNCF